MTTRTLHCYAHGDDAGWEAICLDVEVALQGRSFDEFYQSLKQAIDLYVESLADLPPSDRERLLNRAAPAAVAAGGLGQLSVTCELTL